MKDQSTLWNLLGLPYLLHGCQHVIYNTHFYFYIDVSYQLGIKPETIALQV